MEESLLLAEKIISMLIACFVGWVLVKRRLIGEKEGTTISKLVAYVCSPCAIFSAFQIDFSTDKVNGLFIAMILAVIVLVIYIVFTKLFGDKMGLNGIERASIIYSNAGYLTIPLVYSVLGPEWVFYTCGYSAIQTLLFWSHCKALVCGEKKIEWKKALINPNFIAIYLGMITFFFEIRLPKIPEEAVDSFGIMVGTLSMVVVGILMAGIHFKKDIGNKKIYIVCFLRLIFLPMLVIGISLIAREVIYHPDLGTIMMIVLWAAAGPVGATVTQLAQIYGADAEYAAKINMISVILCAVTMPVLTAIYQWY